MAGPQKFWMVFNSNGRAPKRRHTSLAEAAKEATRIAAAQPGGKVYVLEALGYASTGEATDGGVFGPVQQHEFGGARKPLTEEQRAQLQEAIERGGTRKIVVDGTIVDDLTAWPALSSPPLTKEGE